MGTRVRAPSHDARIIIIGCGLAGLRCASSLVRDHGFTKYQIVLLEASDRIGGRIKTDESFVEGFAVSDWLRSHLYLDADIIVSRTLVSTTAIFSTYGHLVTFHSCMTFRRSCRVAHTHIG